MVNTLGSYLRNPPLPQSHKNNLLNYLYNFDFHILVTYLELTFVCGRGRESVSGLPMGVPSVCLSALGWSHPVLMTTCVTSGGEEAHPLLVVLHIPMFVCVMFLYPFILQWTFGLCWLWLFE